MESFEEEDRRRAEKSRQVALFRYSLIQEVIDPALSTRQRGALCRRIAEQEHTDAFGRQVTVTGGLWTGGCGTGAGVASPRSPTPRRCVPRTLPELLELAVALKKEKPERTAAQVRRILRTSNGGRRPSALRSSARFICAVGRGSPARPSPRCSGSPPSGAQPPR
jgi:putative transposase